MAKKDAKKYPMPQWIWNLNPRMLNASHQRLLAFIWSCGDTGLRSWNYYIAKKYQVSPRTIRRWLNRLDRLNFIYINFPRTRWRTIYRMRFHNIVDYYKFRARLTTYVSGSKVSYINTPQERNKLKSAYSSPPADTAETPEAAVNHFSPSNAGGLGRSGSAEKPNLEK